MGGGAPLGRIINIVGDKSTGKTLQAIELAANFARQYPRGEIEYFEGEHAFDPGYAAAVGMPIDRVTFTEKDDTQNTVQHFYKTLEAFADNCKKRGVPGLYILDSLDSISDDAEQERSIDQASYGQDKAKKMSELFRKLTGKIEKANVCVLIISQVRDAIGVTFGKKQRRSGGKALDFYASLVIWLAKLKTLNVVRGGITRAVGIRIKAKADKNKIALPFRECEYDIQFGYGIDDIGASLDWLTEHKRLDKLELDMNRKQIEAAFENEDAATRAELKAHIDEVVVREWYEVEKLFLPKRSKYD